VYNLFKNYLSNLDYMPVESNDWLTANNEMENRRKEAVVAYFAILFHHLRGETEENHENLSFKLDTSRIQGRKMTGAHDAG
jgi:hypothetical protein